MMKNLRVTCGIQDLRFLRKNNETKHNGTTIIECMISLTLFLFLLYWLIPWTISAFSINNRLTCQLIIYLIAAQQGTFL